MTLYTKKDIQDKSAFNKNIESRNIIRKYKSKSPISRSAKALLLEMLNGGFTEHHAKQATYARFLEVSIPTITRALKELKDLNLIILTRKTTGNVCVYEINHTTIQNMYSSEKRLICQIDMMNQLNHSDEHNNNTNNNTTIENRSSIIISNINNKDLNQDKIELDLDSNCAHTTVHASAPNARMLAYAHKCGWKQITAEGIQRFNTYTAQLMKHTSLSQEQAEEILATCKQIHIRNARDVAIAMGQHTATQQPQPQPQPQLQTQHEEAQAEPTTFESYTQIVEYVDSAYKYAKFWEKDMKIKELCTIHNIAVVTQKAETTTQATAATETPAHTQTQKQPVDIITDSLKGGMHPLDVMRAIKQQQQQPVQYVQPLHFTGKQQNKNKADVPHVQLALNTSSLDSLLRMHEQIVKYR